MMLSPSKLRVALLVVAALTACAKEEAAPDVAAAGGVPVEIEVEPDETTIAPGATAEFAAAVSGTADTAVIWDVVEPEGGTVDETGVYTAPQTSGTFHVRATSRSNPNSRHHSTVIVTAPVAIAVAPATATVAAGGTLTFAATVTNTTNTAVTWRIVEPSCGTITAAGVYTAPPSAAACTVVATSVADSTKTSSSRVTVTAAPAPVAIAVAPATATVVAGGTLTFAATVTNTTNTAVTWRIVEPSCGTITAAGVYTAPPSAAACTVVATSQADSTKTSSSRVTVTAAPAPVAIAITTAPAAADACTTVTFTATVTGATDRSVRWSVQETTGGTITTAGVYRAPEDAGTYHIVATSNADPTKTAVAPIAISDRILAVAVSPAQITLPPGGTASFTATVTTTCGTTSSVRTITAALAAQ